MPKIENVEIIVDGMTYILSIPIEGGETLHQFDDPLSEEQDNTEYVGMDDDDEMEATVVDEDISLIDDATGWETQDQGIQSETIELGSVTIQFDPQGAKEEAGSSAGINDGLKFEVGIEEVQPSPVNDEVDANEDQSEPIVFPVINYEWNEPADDAKDADTPTPLDHVDETVRGKPLVPPDNTQITQASSSASGTDIDINKVEEAIIDFGEIDPQDIDAIHQRVDELGMSAASVSATPETHPPGLVIAMQGNGVEAPEAMPVVDSVTGTRDDTPEIMPVDEDDEEPDSPEAIERRKKRRKGGLEAAAMILGGLVLAGGLGYLFIKESSGSSAPVRHVVPKAKAQAPPTKATTPTSTTPTQSYTSAEFAKFCQAAHTYPAITLATTTPPATLKQQFTTANTSISGMEHYADSGTKPLIASINATESQIEAIIGKAGWSLSAVPAGQYPTLQTEAQALNTEISRLNTETSKCSS